jgi:membrane associated rhomboid family serine protease
MATKTFGRRGAPPRIASAAFQPVRVAAAPAAVLDQPAEPSTFDLLRDNKLIADIPFLTFGLIAFLLLIFWLEKRFAFDIGRDGDLSVRSLIAFGATSRDLVIGSGHWWRIALAPLLHASVSHVVGNSIALAFVGIRLEPMIGRGWFLLIFVISALGGVAGSLYGNPPGISSVGASGAITGMIGAFFVMSFNPMPTSISGGPCARRRCASACRRSPRSPGARRAGSTISAMRAGRWRAPPPAW